MAELLQPAPELQVERWVQGPASSIIEQRGKVILIKVFQVNCPGCFIGGFPEVIKVFETFSNQGLMVWGLATAFEVFHQNNLENLELLINEGRVAGDTLNAMGGQGLLTGDRLTYTIPFPVAWDSMVRADPENLEARCLNIIQRDIPTFDSLNESQKANIKKQIMDYLKKKPFDAETFETYKLQGTPSCILIDKKGILRHKLFGFGVGLESHVQELIEE